MSRGCSVISAGKKRNRVSDVIECRIKTARIQCEHSILMLHKAEQFLRLVSVALCSFRIKTISQER